MPARRTSGGDPGLLLPTPRASDCGTNRGGAAGREGKERPSIGTMLTPTAKDNLTAPAMQKWAEAREMMALLRVAMEQVPTCTASDGGVEPLDRPTGRKLVTVVDARLRCLATPTARDWRSGKASPETMAKNSRPLNEQLCTLGITQETALLAIYEWLMAFPPGWHASGAAPTETPSSSLSCEESSLE